MTGTGLIKNGEWKLVVISGLIGLCMGLGAAWAASMERPTRAEIRQEFTEIQNDLRNQITSLSTQVRSQNERLSRMEGKLDMALGKQGN